MSTRSAGCGPPPRVFRTAQQSRGVRRLFVAILLVLFVLCSNGASFAADDAGVSITGLKSAGLAGVHKVSRWVPIRVGLNIASRQPGRRLVLLLPDADGNAVRYSEPIDADASGDVTIEVTARSGRQDARLEVRVEDAERRVLAQQRFTPVAVTVASKATDSATGSTTTSTTTSGSGSHSEWTTAQRLDTPVWLTLGELPGLRQPDHLPEADSAPTEPTPVIAAVNDAALLPESVEGYASANAVAISLQQKGAAAVTGMTPRQREALHQWVREGGHLVVALGGSIDLNRSNPLADRLPFRATGSVDLRRFAPLESYSRRDVPLLHRGAIPCTTISFGTGKVALGDLSTPLIIRMPMGFGCVTAMNLDVTTTPISAWQGLPAVWRRLITESAVDRRFDASADATGARLSRTGVSDIATQWVTSGMNFPGRRNWSFWEVLGLIVLFASVVSVVDFALVTFAIRRPEMTWVTLPFWTAAATGLAFLGGGLFQSTPTENGLQVSRLALVDFDVPGKALRQQSWSTFLSARTQRFDVGVHRLDLATGSLPATRGDASPSVVRNRLGWSAPGEDAMGGVYRGAAFDPGARVYDAESGSLARVPIRHGSTVTLNATSYSTNAPAPVSAELVADSFGKLTGRITQRFGVTLEQVVVASGQWIYRPRGAGSLRTDLEWSPSGPTSERRELKAFLTGTTASRKELRTGSELVFKTEPYNPFERDPSYVLRMATFHTAAGGRAYTDLDHSVEPYLEMTSLLQLGRAVLIGRIDRPAEQLTVNGQAVSVGVDRTFVRIVLPVRPADEVRTYSNPDASRK